MSLTTIRRRLALLESETPPLGYRVFEQDVQDPTVYRDALGEPVSREAITALSAAGWHVTVIMWQEDAHFPEAIRMTWGEAGEPIPENYSTDWE